MENLFCVFVIENQTPRKTNNKEHTHSCDSLSFSLSLSLSLSSLSLSISLSLSLSPLLQVDQLRAKNRDLIVDLEALRVQATNDVQNLNSALASAKQQKSQVDRSLAAQERQLQLREKELDELQQAHSEACREMKTRNDSSARTTAELNELRCRLSAAENATATAKSANEQLNLKLKEAAQELSVTRHERDEVNRHVSGLERRVAQFEAQLSDKSSKMALLQQRLDDKTRQLSTATQQQEAAELKFQKDLNDAEQRVKAAQAEKSAVATDQGKLANDLTVAVNKNAELERRLSEFAKVRDDDVAAHQATVKDLDELRKAHSTLTTTLQQTQTAHCNAQRQLEEQQSAQNDLSSTLSAIKSDYDSALATRDAEQKNVEMLKQQLSQTQELLAVERSKAEAATKDQEDSLAAAAEMMDELENRFATSEEENSKLTEELKKVNLQLQDRDQRLKNAEESGANFETMCRQLEERVSTLTAQLDGVESDRVAASKKSDAFESLLAKQTSMLDKVQREKNEAVEEKRTLGETAASLQVTVTSLREEHASLTSRLTSASDIIAQKEQDMSDVTRSREKLQNELAAATARLSEVSASESALHAKLSDQVSANDNMATVVEQLQAEKKEMSDSLVQTQEKMASLAAELHSSGEKLDEVTSACQRQAETTHSGAGSLCTTQSRGRRRQ